MIDEPYYIQRTEDRHQVVFDAEDPLLPELLREYAKVLARTGGREERITRVRQVLERVTRWQRSRQDKVPT